MLGLCINAATIGRATGRTRKQISAARKKQPPLLSAL
jgi:hypothetical protein